VGIVMYSGNDDSLIPHRGTELAIQNTTFGGIQGFTRKPATPWYNDASKLAGVVHQERGWSYVLFLNSGHLVPSDAPLSVSFFLPPLHQSRREFNFPLFQAYTFLREFVLGNNKTGLVTKILNQVVVLGGELASLTGVIPGPDPIYYGNGATQSTYVFPQATRTAWNAFLAKETAPPKKS
jgi:carboxypeptidase D